MFVATEENFVRPSRELQRSDNTKVVVIVPRYKAKPTTDKMIQCVGAATVDYA